MSALDATLENKALRPTRSVFEAYHGGDEHFQLLAGDSALRLLHPDDLQVLREIEYAFEIQPTETAGVLISTGDPSVALLPRSIEPSYFHPLASGVSLNAKSAVPFSRSVTIVRPMRSERENRGYIQVKPAASWSVNSDAVRVNTPAIVYQDASAQYMREYALDKAPKDGLYAFHRLGTAWSVVRGMFESSALVEFENGLQYARLFKEIFGAYPDVQLPVGIHRVHTLWDRKNKLVPIEKLLTQRAVEYSDERQMMEVRLLDKEAQALENRSISKQDVLGELSKFAEHIRTLDEGKLTKLFLLEMPLVQTKYYTPTFFRNAYAAIVLQPEEYAFMYTALQDATGIYQNNILQQQLYVGFLHELLYMNGYQAKSVFVPDFDQSQSFATFQQQVNTKNHKVLERIVTRSGEKIGSMLGMLNAIGMIGTTMIQLKDNMAGEPADWDLGRSGQESVYIPSVRRPGKIQVDTAFTDEQLFYVRENLKALSHMLSTEGSYSVVLKAFIESYSSAFHRTKGMYESLSLDREHIAALRDRNLEVPMFLRNTKLLV